MAMGQQGPERIIIGIDLGTTYSAVAWTQLSDRKIEVIRNWPTNGQLVGSKVPSEIAYPIDGNESGEVSWGYDISPRHRRIKWFKLSLEATEKAVGLPDGLDAIDVATDYLKLLHGHIMGTLLRRVDARILQHAKFDYVLTVPAIWSDIARKRTLTAATRAGLTGPNSTLELLSEPESAAVFSLKTIENVLQHVKVGDKIVVCDAGGGTVDLVAYDLKQIHPKLEVSECTAGTGDFCGSAFIDREFDKFFRNRMGTAYDQISFIHRQRIIKNFETCKLAFRDDPTRQTFYVNIPAVGDIPHAGIRDGDLEISRDEMRAIFDPIINSILDLLGEQVKMASEGGNVNYILLVGGFGESEYLYNRIHDWAAPLGISVLQPRDAGTAVVQGAVLKGLESRLSQGQQTSIARRARISYGVPTKELFIEGQHLEVDAEWDEHTGKKLARNQIRWFIRTNQLVSDDEVVRYRFRRRFKHLTTWEDSLVSSALPVPPPRMDGSVRKHCTIRSDLTHLNLKRDFVKERTGLFGSSFYTAEYDLVVSLRGGNLNLSLMYRGQQYGIANVVFEALV